MKKALRSNDIKYIVNLRIPTTYNLFWGSIVSEVKRVGMVSTFRTVKTSLTYPSPSFTARFAVTYKFEFGQIMIIIVGNICHPNEVSSLTYQPERILQGKTTA